MSRIAKKPIIIPAKTTASYATGVFSVKGPLGEIKKSFSQDISIVVADNTITIAPAREDIPNMAMWGSYASHIKNMLAGVNKAYEKKLIKEKNRGCKKKEKKKKKLVECVRRVFIV